MSTSSRLRSGCTALALVSAALVPGCGGGGGGSSGGTNGSSFILSDVKYGRMIDEGSGDKLVSPLTTVAIDPVTGIVLPGSLEPLAPEVDIPVLQSLGLGSDYLPRVIPRNGVLQLEFTSSIDPNSVIADVLDAAGNVLVDGSVQVRMQDGRGIAVEVRFIDSRTIWINPVTSATIGFPPSPVVFGPAGAPVADATGFLKLILPKKGGAVLRSTGGDFLGSRTDQLGDPASPVGINPGNRVLDFIAQNKLIPTNETFNGFLPDMAAPRIARTVAITSVISFAQGDSVGTTTIEDASANYATAMNGGSGEWSGTSLTLRPGQPLEEVHTVLSNTRTRVTIVGSFNVLPQDGDTFKLARAELFEPVISDPIDAARFDPNNPENARNVELANFIEVWEIDALGNAVAGPTSLHDPVPAFSELRVHFSEPMAADSFGQWESFRVAFNPDGGTDSELLTQIVLDPTQTVATIRPVRVDQQAGTVEIVGWGRGVKPLQLIVTISPKRGYLQLFMSSDEVAAYLDQGVRGLNDIGGQPLGFPASQFDPGSPAIRYSAPFVSDEARSTQLPPPVVESWGVMVHRHQGRPVTGIDPATLEAGVAYRDQVNYYRPIADINLQANGFLAGAPVVFVSKIHDDYFPPSHGQFGAFPLGTGVPLISAGTGSAPAPHDGARFQNVYRDEDCSPSRDALAGTLLDLYRVSWAPIGNHVTSDTYEDISIHAAHSSYRPATWQNTAAAGDPYSGLGQAFDFAAWESLYSGSGKTCKASCSINEGPNYWDSLVTLVLPGTQYKISPSSLYSPPNDGNAYHPWPTFTTPFQYNNGAIPQTERDLRKSMNQQYNCNDNGAGTVWYEKRKFSNNQDLNNFGGDSLMLEVRVRPQKTPISRQNGFTFCVGVLLDFLPKFRVYTVGAKGVTINPDNINGDEGARCAIRRQDAPDGVNNGDNSRYFAVFDYVKTTSRITSPFLRVNPGDTVSPDYFPAIFDPPLADQPVGTTVIFEFAGAINDKGTSSTGFSTDINGADGQPNLAYRVTVVGNTTTTLLPTFDLVAIPYLRPQGN